MYRCGDGESVYCGLWFGGILHNFGFYEGDLLLGFVCLLGCFFVGFFVWGVVISFSGL